MQRLYILPILLLHSLSLAAMQPGTPLSVVQAKSYTTSSTIIDLLGEKASQAYQSIMPLDETISWEVYVPASYDAAKSAGVLVYISPNDSGAVPKQGWKALLDKHNLIWIGANQSGNKIDTHKRMTYALMALAVLDKQYKVNQNRIYLSGFSGGGRVASLLAIQYSSLFKGAIYNCGANRWDKKSAIALDTVKTNRYVFITGKKDFNLQDTKRVYRAYKKAGIEQIKLMVIPSMDHSNPNKNYYEKAIMFLDGLLATKS